MLLENERQLEEERKRKEKEKQIELEEKKKRSTNITDKIVTIGSNEATVLEPLKKQRGVSAIMDDINSTLQEFDQIFEDISSGSSTSLLETTPIETLSSLYETNKDQNNRNSVAKQPIHIEATQNVKKIKEGFMSPEQSSPTLKTPPTNPIPHNTVKDIIQQLSPTPSPPPSPKLNSPKLAVSSNRISKFSAYFQGKHDGETLQTKKPTGHTPIGRVKSPFFTSEGVITDLLTDHRSCDMLSSDDMSSLDYQMTTRSTEQKPSGTSRKSHDDHVSIDDISSLDYKMTTRSTQQKPLGTSRKSHDDHVSIDDISSLDYKMTTRSTQQKPSHDDHVSVDDISSLDYQMTTRSTQQKPSGTSRKSHDDHVSICDNSLIESGKKSPDSHATKSHASLVELNFGTSEKRPSLTMDSEDSLATPIETKIGPIVHKKPVHKTPLHRVAAGPKIDLESHTPSKSVATPSLHLPLKENLQSDALLLDSLSDEELEIPTQDNVTMTTSDKVYRSNSALSSRNITNSETQTHTNQKRRHGVRSVGDANEIVGLNDCESLRVPLESSDKCRSLEGSSELTTGISPDNMYHLNYQTRYSFNDSVENGGR